MRYLVFLAIILWAIRYTKKMRTFVIALALVGLFVVWLLNKPIPQKTQVARAFTDSEIEYLEKSFDYAMDTLEDGQTYDWSVAAVNGRISAGKTYQSKQKATCRPFAEVARTHSAQKVDAGAACKRVGREGWCRVYGENPQSCALEKQEAMLTKRTRFAIMQGTQMLDSAASTILGIDPGSMLPNAPHVSSPDMPYVGPIGAPSLDLEPRDFRPPMPWDPKQ